MTRTDFQPDKGLDLVVRKVLNQRGIDLQQYKPSFVRRRLDVRVRARGVDDYVQYASVLEKDPSEFAVLFDALSINVTEFFRDKDVFDTFANHIIPRLLSGTSTGEDIRVWSVGCSSGEEAYTVALLLAQGFDSLNRIPRFKVIGTDFSVRAIDAARKGRYPYSSVRKAPPSLVGRYFRPSIQEGYLEVNDELKNFVTFELGDLATVSPTKFTDAIFCRNVLIYFGREMQVKLFGEFYQSLKAGGYLVLGKAETVIGAPSGLFEVAMPQERIYRKKTGQMDSK